MSNEEDDKELSTWRSEWQTLGGQEDLAAELVARAAKDGRKMRRAAAMEVLGALFSTSVSLWLVVHFRGALEVTAIMTVILLFNGGWLTHFFTTRAQLFDSSAEGLAPFIELTRKRLATELRWARFARRWMMALAIPLVPWAIWVFIGHRAAYMAAPWRAVVGFGGAAAIFAGVYVWTRVKERKLRHESESFERHVADVQLA
jgi:hypothetical protein